MTVLLSSRRCTGAPIALLLLLSVGCGESKFEFAEVEGVVTLDGEPVADAWVVFMPTSRRDDGEAGPFSKGETDAEGRYRLRSVQKSPRDGAVIGQHKIVVSTRRAHLDPNNLDREIVDVEESIPFLYVSRRDTPLRYDVPPEGTDAANFELESRRRR